MKKIYTFLLALMFGFFAFGQIYEPEGINMPGSWDSVSWSNPPTIKQLASELQAGGTVHLVKGLYHGHYQTIFNTLSSNGNVVSGNYEFLFTSGPSSNYYQNTWKDVTVSFDNIQVYNYNGSSNNTVTLNSDKWYVVNFEDNGYDTTRAIFMELSGQPATITGVTQVPDTSAVPDGQDVTVSLDLDIVPPAEQVFVLRYSTDNWNTFDTVFFHLNGGLSLTAVIPGQAAGTQVSYYVFSTTQNALTNMSSPTSDDYDLVTINFDNNSGKNYTYTVQQTTGLANESKGEVIIYPNPARDVVMIANAGGSDLEITDLHGRVVRSYHNIAENARINVYDLEPGVYLFNIHRDGRLITRKVSVR